MKRCKKLAAALMAGIMMLGSDGAFASEEVEDVQIIDEQAEDILSILDVDEDSSPVLDGDNYIRYPWGLLWDNGIRACMKNNNLHKKGKLCKLNP